MLGWEIHGVNEDGTPIKMQDGRPFAMFKNYTLSWSDKATLRIDLQAWRGRPFTAEEMRRFDLKTILGAWCMLNVIERQGTDGKMYVNVANISPVPVAMKQKKVIENGEEKIISILPKPINKNEMFNLSDPDMEMFNTFSDNLKKKIQGSPEFEKAKAPPSAKMTTTVDAAGEYADQDIPF